MMLKCNITKMSVNAMLFKLSNYTSLCLNICCYFENLFKVNKSEV
jgi:hypothetical protein